MMRTTTNTHPFCACALTVAIAAFLFTPAFAAPINYGDFAGSTVMYLDVTETANTPGDSEPQYGAPSILGDKLDFDPAGFTATSTGGLPDLTDGQLNFTMMGVPGAAISTISLSEGGDYNLLGTGTAATQIHYGLGLTSIVVLEVDGSPLASPVSLGAISTGGSDDLSLGADLLTPWSLDMLYDVNAALDAAKVDYIVGATKLEIAIDNTLAAISEASSIAFIAKKDFMVDVTVTPFDPFNIPEPSTFVLLGLALCGVVAGGSLRD